MWQLHTHHQREGYRRVPESTHQSQNERHSQEGRHTLGLNEVWGVAVQSRISLKEKTVEMVQIWTKTALQSICGRFWSILFSPAVLLWRRCRIKEEIWNPTVKVVASGGCQHPAGVRVEGSGNTHCHFDGVISVGLGISLGRSNKIHFKCFGHVNHYLEI